VGLVDWQQERLGTVGDQFGIAVRAMTARQLLNEVRIDALVAACPPLGHEEILALAIEHRVPVWVEKPPATSTPRLVGLARAADDNAVTTGVGMNFRWAEPVRELWRLLARPEIGRPLSVVVQHQANKPLTPLWDMSLLRSFLFAQSIHPIDLLIALTGGIREPQVLCHSSGEGLQVDIQAATTGGGTCSLVTGIHRARLRTRIEVTTTSGVRLELSDLSELTVTGLDEPGWSRTWRPSPLQSGYTRAGFLPELAAFVEAVATGRPYTPGLADLVPTYQLTDLICRTGSAE
jgi:predicted dehydrogenase